jgi:hypothetical protein
MTNSCRKGLVAKHLLGRSGSVAPVARFSKSFKIFAERSGSPEQIPAFEQKRDERNSPEKYMTWSRLFKKAAGYSTGSTTSKELPSVLRSVSATRACHRTTACSAFATLGTFLDVGQFK